MLSKKKVFCETINAWKESFSHNTCNVVHLCGQGAQSLIFYISNSMNYTTKELRQTYKYLFKPNKNTFFYFNLYFREKKINLIESTNYS